MTCTRDQLLPATVLLSIVATHLAIPDVGAQTQSNLNEIGGKGVAGAQCPLFVDFTAPDGCSTCSCSVDGRMTDCERSACPEPRGNYTKNECIEGALYKGQDGCNSCQCNAWRSFSWCTRRICLESLPATPPPASLPDPPRYPTFPLQRPPGFVFSHGETSPPYTPTITTTTTPTPTPPPTLASAQPTSTPTRFLPLRRREASTSGYFGDSPDANPAFTFIQQSTPSPSQSSRRKSPATSDNAANCTTSAAVVTIATTATAVGAAGTTGVPGAGARSRGSTRRASDSGGKSSNLYPEGNKESRLSEE